MTRHPTDVVSLGFGILFTILGGFLLADRVDLIVRLHWAWPLLLIVVAVLMILSAARRRPAPAWNPPPAAPEERPGATGAPAGTEADTTL
jgi:cytochrome c-type biogenesis protein CcmH/NrfF